MNPLCGQSLILFELQTKKEHPDLIPSPTPNLFPLNTNLHSSQLLLSSGKRASPPSVRGWADPPCTLGLQRSLWEDVNSAPSLPQESMTQDLLDPWSRAWSTGSVREAEFSHAGQELRHLQEPKWGVLSTEDSPEPLGFGVEMGLGG